MWYSLEIVNSPRLTPQIRYARLIRLFAAEGGSVTRRGFAVRRVVRAGAFRIRNDQDADLMKAPVVWTVTMVAA
jgi:hypothetical protein